MTAQVLVVMGSDSDFPVMKDTLKVLEEFSVPYEVRVCSAHRSPEATRELAGFAETGGCRVIIAGAGMAAHLAGTFAALCTVPVIGVPIDAGALRGVDALYATSQMPPGVPVASMGIGRAGARNAGMFAVEILALTEEGLKEALRGYKRRMAAEVRAKDERLQSELPSRLRD